MRGLTRVWGGVHLPPPSLSKLSEGEIVGGQPHYLPPTRTVLTSSIEDLRALTFGTSSKEHEQINIPVAVPSSLA